MNPIVQQALDVIQTEADGILELKDHINENFAQMVELICRAKGRLIVSGIGKSGIIGQKIVATLNSTGTRALFLHPVEALHGDLGLVSARDVFLGLSNSGETDELIHLLPIIRDLGCPVISFTGNPDSPLAQQSDLVIHAGISREACPLGLAPTTSTTAAMVLGDALAVCLINKKQFKASDFQKFHPGGNLGQRLAANVSALMLTGAAIPWVVENTELSQALQILNQQNLGTVFVVRPDHTLSGILTDGDIRRLIIQKTPLADLLIDQVMIKDPRTVFPETPVYTALNIIEKHQIMVLPVVDKTRKLCGVLHIHDILGKGAFTFNGK